MKQEPEESKPSRELLRCANPACSFLIHKQEQYGGFCCKRCHFSLEVNAPTPEHGQKCCKILAPAEASRAEPVPPDVTLQALKKKRNNKKKNEKEPAEIATTAPADGQATVQPQQRPRPEPPLPRPKPPLESAVPQPTCRPPLQRRHIRSRSRSSRRDSGKTGTAGIIMMVGPSRRPEAVVIICQKRRGKFYLEVEGYCFLE